MNKEKAVQYLINIPDSINNLAMYCHEQSHKKGFWDDAKDNNTNIYLSMKLMLVVSELGEAVETLRKNGMDYVNPKTNLPHFAEELADTIIRIFDIAGNSELNLGDMSFGDILMKKLQFNSDRKYKHNKNF